MRKQGDVAFGHRYLSSGESLISIVTAHTRITVLLPLFIHTGSKKVRDRGRGSNLTVPATLLILRT